MGYVGSAPAERDHSIFNLALFSEISRRGQHPSGYFADGKIVKKRIPSFELAQKPSTKKDFQTASVVMVHARYATSGSPYRMENNHLHTAGKFVLIHNGMITNKIDGYS